MKDSRWRYYWAISVLAAIAVGVLIGHFGLHRPGKHPARFAPDARLLREAAPVELSSVFAKVARRVEPTVVNIDTRSVIKLDARDFGSPDSKHPSDGFFNHFFGLTPGHPAIIPQESLGSGFVLDSRGYILTNDHVVHESGSEKPLDKIRVTLHGDDSISYPATIVGEDRATDLAVIKINPRHPLATATLGDSHSMQVGDWVLAIGSPFGLEETVTAGIISARDREIEPDPAGEFKRYLQTDAAINPGNSGGPLINMAGQVIGINTAIATHGDSNAGVGFAIPSDTALRVYNAIITYGYVRRGAIGVRFEPSQPPALLESFGATHGVVISNVTAGGPADRAGLRSADVITSIDGRAIRSPNQLIQIVAASGIGQKLDVGYLRHGHSRVASVVVADRRALVGSGQPMPQRPSAPVPSARPTVGVKVRDLPPDQSQAIQKSLSLKVTEGVEVTEVDPGGFADILGVQPGDVILELNHQPMLSARQFESSAKALKPGQNVLFTVARPEAGAWSLYFWAGPLQ